MGPNHLRPPTVWVLLSVILAVLILPAPGAATPPPGADDCAPDGEAGDTAREAEILVPPQTCHGTLHTVDFMDKHDWYKVPVLPLSQDVQLDLDLCILNPDGVIILQLFFNPFPREAVPIPPDNLVVGPVFVGPGCQHFTHQLEGTDALLGGAWYPFLHGGAQPTEYSLAVA